MLAYGGERVWWILKGVQRIGCHRVTAVVTATTNTLLPLTAPQRTPDAHVVRSDQAPARIC